MLPWSGVKIPPKDLSSCRKDTGPNTDIDTGTSTNTETNTDND